MTDSKKKNTRTIKVDYMARVEGEGALDIVTRDGRVDAVRLKIFEPPRFFEAFMRDRNWLEAPDITARICGICPVAYQMSAVHAMESIVDITLPQPLRELRRLLYCGEWIESHVLHMFLLHAPDFLGYDDAMQMAKDHPGVVERALRLKKAGNAIVQLLGGREIHPINVRVGGFYRIPAAAELAALRETLARAREEMDAALDWAATLPFPDFERDYEFVSVSHADEYPFNEGRIISSAGVDIPCSEYNSVFEEHHIDYSTALHARIKQRGHYFVGPMARFSLNYDKLSPRVQHKATQLGVTRQCRNPYRSLLIRGLETLYAFDEAVRVLDQFERPEQPFVSAEPRAGVGHGATEAPRGLLYHRYEIDDDGAILSAQIVPPTSQNQATIEDDLAALVPQLLSLDDAALTHCCEQTVRNYDPCISCSTHFLKVTRKDQTEAAP